MSPLTRKKLVPLGLLLVLIGILAGTGWISDPVVRGYVIAFCEAGIVGGLADWFAVTALFRHPLGIPIPHTAIIPRRKDALASSLADFIAENFVSVKAVERYMGDTDISAELAGWTLRNRDSLSETALRIAEWGIEVADNPHYLNYLKTHLTGEIEARSFVKIGGELLQLAIDNRHHDAVLEDMLRHIAGILDAQKEKVREQVASGSPWWLPRFVDEKIFDQMVERIQTQLLAMVLDPDHPLRKDLEAALQSLATELTTDSPRQQEFVDLIGRMGSDEDLVQYSAELYGRLLSSLGENIQKNRERYRRFTRRIIGRLAVGTLRDSELRKDFNRWLRSGLLHIVETQGHLTSGLIVSTVAQWDGKQTANRIEAQVGTDLQYIRINGTLVGGLIGLILHAVVS